MCGITGAYAFTEKGKDFFGKLDAAVETLKLRGPDASGTSVHGNVALGHTRLAILDTSSAAAQPFHDPSGRYTIVFNGEIFNFRELKDELPDVVFATTSDTEVLLHLYIRYGDAMLSRLNGFFAFAIHDRDTDSLFLARDRMGIKPLLVYQDGDVLIFGSEMKALMAFGIPKEIDRTSQFLYHQFNYTPFPHTIFEGVKEVEPGSFLEIRNQKSEIRHAKDEIGKEENGGNEAIANRQSSRTCGINRKSFWTLPAPSSPKTSLTYEAAQKELIRLMRLSVQRRMVSDVPLGSFLSGGIDSSVIATLAAEQTDKLRTFSIGYADEPHFDETKYAEAVAKRIGSEHTVFKLTNDDLFANLHQVLDYLDRPFADSSCLPVYILCKETRKHVTVALSGDGADELFSGYNKHAAEFRARSGGGANAAIAALRPLWHLLPSSRNSKWGNTVRQLRKFSDGLNLSPADRYWSWASFLPEKDVAELMGEDIHLSEEYLLRKKTLTEELRGAHGMDEMLYADLHQVLRNDMLTKVDLMSMANSLEVRVPFLDHEVVEFACSLPEHFKINSQMRKRIVQDAFRPMLPPELYQRPKQGFEVPLLKWFRTELRSMLHDDLLNGNFIVEQGMFSPVKVRSLLQNLDSNDPGDAATHVWNLMVFQHWWKRCLSQ
jgi:asparagine synthase (glutamine-hydrolysing)